jgi:hypothetical protein
MDMTSCIWNNLEYFAQKTQNYHAKQQNQQSKQFRKKQYEQQFSYLNFAVISSSPQYGLSHNGSKRLIS